jgi:hypothetical protein
MRRPQSGETAADDTDIGFDFSRKRGPRRNRPRGRCIKGVV